VKTTVAEYLRAITSHDWDALRGCLTDDVVRNGPYGDEYRGWDAYVAFLADLMPALPGYAMDIARITYADGGRLAFAELAETVTVDGSPLRTEESLVFELDDSGLITHIDIYIKTTLSAQTVNR
jgi:hypothetical protein